MALHFAEYSLALAKALSATNQVLLVVGKNNFEMEVGFDSKQFCSDSLEICAIPHLKSALEIPSRSIQIVSRIRAFCPDVIHCQEDTKDYLALALPFFGKVPFLLTVHDPKPHSGLDARRKARSRHGFYSRQLRNRADGVIVHGERLVAIAKETIPHVGGNVFSIPHGPLGEIFEPAPSLSWEVGNCLFFGRIEAYKGLPDFVTAIRMLREEGIACKGVIAGRGSELDRMKPDLLNDQGFEIVDRFLAPSEVVDCFKRANVIVMPYKDATQSGVAAYALGLARPIVATNVGAIPDIVRHEITGLLVPPNDPSAVADAIKRIVVDESLARDLALGAKALGQGEYSWLHIADMTLAAYRCLLSQNLRG